MRLGQHRTTAIPFWCSILAICCLSVGLAACSDRGKEAAQQASLAQQALNNNDLRGARAAIAAAIQERDDVVAYHLLRGRIELALESTSAAYAAYSNARALDATNGEALMMVAQLGLTTGNLRDSLEATDQMLLLAPNNIDALLVRGIHAIVRRDYDEALEYGERILTLSPGHGGGTILKARGLFMSGRAAEALQALDEASGTPELAAPVALTRLEIYRALRRPEELAGEFERLRTLRNDDLALKIDEANLRYKVNERSTAHALVTEVLAHKSAEPGQIHAALNLWQEYGFADLPANAVERAGLSGTVAARQALGRFLIDHERLAEADSLIASLPRGTADGLQARYLAASGSASAAIRAAGDVLSRDSTDCDALIAASESTLSLGRNDDALRYGQQATAECPALAAGWLATARAYQVLDRESGVDRVFVQALDSNKQSTELTRAYTQWLTAQGHTREAVAMARRLTHLAPALISGWELYESLCRKHDRGCIEQAAAGKADARSALGVDLPPGTPRPNGLFGRLVER